MASIPYPTDPTPEGCTRILIVDDSAVARALITRQIEAWPRFCVIGAVTHVDAALAFLAQQEVDIILLDVAMPGIDGITALPRLLAAGQGARIIIVSSSTPAGGTAAVQALAHGAADTLVKPRPQGLSEFSQALLQKLDALAVPQRAAPPPAPASPGAVAMTRASVPDIIGIGASTGGIHALARLLAPLPPTMTVPIVVTQHLPASFISYFAAQLGAVARRPCDVAQDRLRLRPGRIVVAPGDAHMSFAALPDGGAAIRLQRGRARSGCLPSVDPMFAAMARVWGARALGIVLSGMGRDGLEGAQTLKAAGGTMIAQDEASSVVWGMPGAIVAHDLADMVLSPDAIGAMLAQGARR